MRNFIILFAFSTFIISAVVINKNTLSGSRVQGISGRGNIKEEVLSDVDNEDVVEGSGNVKIQPSPTVKPFPNLVTVSPSKPVITPSGVSDVDKFIYPDAKILSRSVNTVELKSYEDPGSVTDWYKEKIKERGMSVTSFVTTSANGNILNKLSGANGNEKVNVEIKRDAGEEFTQIKISLEH